MAKNSITDYDNTSGNNTDVQSVDISEGCSPSGINNAIREVMADLADVNDGTVALTSPQAANMTVTGTVTTDTIAENTSAAGVTIDGVLLKDGGVDVNGNELILDADGDTSITADTDDQIDFKTGGTDRVVIDSSGLSVTGTVTATSFAGDGSSLTNISAGKVLQVVQTVKSNVFVTSSTSWVDITDLSASITPSSTSSKIMVDFHIGAHTTTAASTIKYRIVRGSTAIGIGNSGNGDQATVGVTVNATRGETASMKYLDSPATTSATTYKIQVELGSGTVDINRRSSNYGAISTITLTEIGA